MSGNIKYFICGLALSWTVLLAGCSKSEPVEEISVASSGVAMRDQETWLAESDWPGWRGPNHDGTAVDQPIVTQWDEASNIVWQADVPGRGHSSPVVVGDQVFLTTALEDRQQQRVLCYDRQSGESLWSTLVHEGGFPSEDRMHTKSSHANGTVACDGKRIFASFLNGGRVWGTALDTEGEILWRTDTGSFHSKYGYAPSPILYRSVVILAADHAKGGYLAALDRDTGKIAWRTQRPAPSSYSSPFVGSVAGESQLLICGCEQVASFDPDTGQANWSCAGTTEAQPAEPWSPMERMCLPVEDIPATRRSVSAATVPARSCGEMMSGSTSPPCCWPATTSLPSPIKESLIAGTPPPESFNGGSGCEVRSALPPCSATG